VPLGRTGAACMAIKGDVLSEFGEQAQAVGA